MKNKIIFHSGIEQGSQEWFDLKNSKFSSSEIESLCKPKGLGVGGLTYIDKKVAEYLTNKHTEIKVFAMEWGKYHEPIAKLFYENASDVKIQDVAFVENPLYPNCGVSPDGIIFKDRVGFEIKCPETGANHVKHLSIKNQTDLKKINPKYYWQIMFCMLITGFEKWKFISFHPHFILHKDLKMYEVDIYYNQTDIDLLIDRIG